MKKISGTNRCAAVALTALIMLIVVVGADCAWSQGMPLGGLRSHNLQPSYSSGHIVGWLLARQAEFYRQFSGLIRAAKADGSAVWTLLGLSFLYGIFHAAGPGHGKAVISSYLVANEETWIRGVVLSLVSAMLQAVVAVVVVAVAAVVLDVSASAMNSALNAIETFSYVLIMLIGVRLLWVKSRGFANVWRATVAVPKGASVSAGARHGHATGCDHTVEAEDLVLIGDNHRCGGDHVTAAPHLHVKDADVHPYHSHHEHADHGPFCNHDHSHHHHTHNHDHGSAWGHAHAPEPVELAGPGGWKRGFSAVVAVGLRPCSGAILVLAFALAQGLFLVGVGATFTMAIGTFITVAVIATIAVGAGVWARRMAASKTGYGMLAMRGIEVCAALLVTIFGVLLLGGYMVNERIIGF